MTPEVAKAIEQHRYGKNGNYQMRGDNNGQN